MRYGRYGKTKLLPNLSSSFKDPTCICSILSVRVLVRHTDRNSALRSTSSSSPFNPTTHNRLKAMGIFNRKSAKIQTNGEIRKSSFNSSSTLKSPPPTHSSQKNSPFVSPSALDVTLPNPPDPTTDPAAYLRSIWAVRARCQLVHQRAKRNQLAHFDVDGSKFGETANYLVSIIKVEQQAPSFWPFTNRLRYRETTLQTTPKYLLTADGNTSKQVDGLESTNSSHPGRHRSMRKKRPAV